MGGESGPFESIGNLAIFGNKILPKPFRSNEIGKQFDKALGMDPPDMSEVDAMYMSQAKDTENNIKALQLAEANKRKIISGVRSGGGSSTQGVPTLTSISSAPQSGAQSLFGDK